MKVEHPHRRFDIHKSRSHATAILLQPAALAYRLCSSLQRNRKGRGEAGPLRDTKIISVGNLEVGGGGKTPFCIYLLDYLMNKGYRPAYISRGYKSESERLKQAVTVVLPDQPDTCSSLDSGVRYLSRDSKALCSMIGDEGALIASRNRAVPIVISKSKSRAVRAASSLFQPSHIVLDDAFQSWGVYRDIDILLLDAVKPFGNGRLLPAGTLREPASAMRRADGIGLNGIEDVNELPRFERSSSSLLASHATVFGIHRGITLQTAYGEFAEVTRDAVASLSSIARPDGFDQLLQLFGCDIRLSIRFPDHFRYRAEDIAAVHRLVKQNDIRRLITTEKDWVKLSNYAWQELEIIIARLDLSIQPEDFLEKIKKPQAMLAAST
jgi:tetraacyldisaccharide 4'-kinase